MNLPGNLPLGFHEWQPAAQAVTLALLTFVQEDVPTVGAALLAGAGRLGLGTGFWGCFLGIWLGDALLYLLARGVGRPLLAQKWSQRFFNPAAVARSEKWFSRKGTWLLVSSRFVPGTRLPTYLAAGFLRVSFPRFLLVTGLAVGIWTVAIFTLAHTFGVELSTGLQRWQSSGWIVVLAAVTAAALLRFAMKLANAAARRRMSTALLRWTRWEFWPAWLFYPPVVLWYVWLALKHRGLTLPTSANPGIFSGGMVGESKLATLRDLAATSPEFTAPAFAVTGRTLEERLGCVHKLLAASAIAYPFIVKPDAGQRGVGVKLIRDAAQLEEMLRQTSAPLLAQRYAPGPHEAGVFYYRLPHEAGGHIFAITEKIFPHLTGDGHSTVEELLWQDDRARFLAAKYLQRLGPRREEVLPAGVKLKLVEAGNHAQGCVFQDGTDRLHTPALLARIDEISRGLTGFFIGRYDVRYASEEDFRAGKSFQIIELNGAAAEATSIYDARHSFWSAYRTLFRQWELVFAIGAANRALGHQPDAPLTLWRAWRHFRQLAATYPSAD